MVGSAVRPDRAGPGDVAAGASPRGEGCCGAGVTAAGGSLAGAGSAGAAGGVCAQALMPKDDTKSDVDASKRGRNDMTTPRLQGETSKTALTVTAQPHVVGGATVPLHPPVNPDHPASADHPAAVSMILSSNVHTVRYAEGCPAGAPS